MTISIVENEIIDFGGAYTPLVNFADAHFGP